VADFALVRLGRKRLPQAILRTLSGKVIAASVETPEAVCYRVPAYTGVVLSWE
jgi:hypothetical protein